MDQEALVAEICDRADNILASAATRKEAREDLSEWLGINHALLSPADKKAVMAQAIGILESEGFFDTGTGPNE